MKVKTEKLFLLGGIVWMIAGFNVFKLGYEGYKIIDKSFGAYALSFLVFICFMNIFYRINKKHEKRIIAFVDDRRPFWNFFDKKSYMIMIVMIVPGIALRKLNLVGDVFVAIFYSGLGLALFIAGLVFINFYVKHGLRR